MIPSTCTDESTLFQPIQVGNMTLAHRVIMAPISRFRTDEKHILLPQVVEYYRQRASIPGTLIITEATVIAPQAGGYKEREPGIWNKEQMEVWKKVVNAVHEKKSYIYLQLWALGRVAYPEVLQKEGFPYVSASPVPLSDRQSTDPAPRELTLEEIKQYTQWYREAAENAVEAGFDGVEIHGANGYLIDQFLQDVCNRRTDGYGGSIENRTRFVLEVIDAVVESIGQKKTALRISPTAEYQDMGMQDPVPTYTHLVNELGARYPNLAYLHAVERRIGGDKVVNDRFAPGGDDNDFIRRLWSDKGRILITAGGYTRDCAMEVSHRKGDIVAFGRLFIANPDLPYRLKRDLPLNKGDRSRYYTGKEDDPKGYTDYPFTPEFIEEYGNIKEKSGTWVVNVAGVFRAIPRILNVIRNMYI